METTTHSPVEDPPRAALERAIIAGGGPTALGKLLGITPEGVIRWRKRGKVPAERARQVETVTGVPKEELRPDLWPPMAKEAAE